MSNKISHEGIIDRIDEKANLVQVRIVQSTACSACKIAGHCNASESKEKTIDVRLDTAPENIKIGQSVIVWASRNVAGRALLLGFGLPFVLMIFTLVLILLLTQSEGLAAMSGIAVLLPYYLVLWLYRKRIAEGISFQIEAND